MGHIFHMMAHPHGWWILLDILVFGVSGTLGIMIGNDD